MFKCISSLEFALVFFSFTGFHEEFYLRNTLGAG